MDSQQSERPLSELFGELARETGTLLKQELQLARAETVAKVKLAGLDVALMAIGGLLALMGGFAFAATGAIALSLVLPLWLATLITGAVLSVMGALCAVFGLRALKRIDPMPRETIQTLQEDRQWVSEQISR